MNESVRSRAGDRAGRMRDNRDGSRYGGLRVVGAGLGVLAVLALSGCAGSSRAGSVDPPRAREALKTALDHWKNGEDPKSLASSMTAQDFEWASGAKLIDYQVLDDGKVEDANLRVQVKIKLGPQGKSKAVEKTASYVIGTSPSVTVFRDVLRR